MTYQLVNSQIKLMQKIQFHISRDQWQYSCFRAKITPYSPKEPTAVIFIIYISQLDTI